MDATFPLDELFSNDQDSASVEDDRGSFAAGCTPDGCGQNGHSVMSPHRLALCMLTIGWSVRELARRSGEHRTQIQRCLDGASVFPPLKAAWLEDLAAAHEARPCPRRKPLPF